MYNVMVGPQEWAMFQRILRLFWLGLATYLDRNPPLCHPTNASLKDVY